MSDTSSLHTSDKILTASNCISFFRIFLAIPTVIFLLHDDMAPFAADLGKAVLTQDLAGLRA